MRSLSGLNPQQTEAVRAVDHHLLVVAGAGSGKTRVLTHKIGYLIEERGIAPSEVLAMTFSNKAALEMRDRVRLLFPSYEQPAWVGTFHSSCLRMLKEFSTEAGLSPHFTIYDESDQLSAVKKALKDLNYDPKQIPPKVIRYHIGRAKNDTSDLIGYLEEGGTLSDRALDVVRRYTEILAQNQALDFGDLLTRTVQLLRANHEVRDYLQHRWPRLLIDEYQDTNQIQKELIIELAGPHGVVCAVGDEDQSIYGWRGARVENILEFEHDFPGAQTIKLEQNYRSTRKILRVANNVIANNFGRRGKELWTENAEGVPVTFYLADDDHAEASFVLDQIEAVEREGDIPTGEISVFYRTHVQSRVFEDQLRRRNRPYQILGGIRFYERAEIKDALAFLRLALNPADNVSFTRIVNQPPRGIGATSLQKLAQLADARRKSMLDAIPEFEVKGKARKGLETFRAWFDTFRAKMSGYTPAEALEKVLEKSGFLQALESEGTIESESRVENLQELLRSMEEFREETGGDLAAYLDRISLVSDTDRLDDKGEMVTLMTVHNSKGLEFDCVFVVGLEEGIFPHQRSIDEGDRDEIEEERRLCYVAMTRARKRLTLSAASRRRLYHSTQFNPVSRFVGEIPARELLHLNERGQERTEKSRRRRASLDHFADEYRQEAYDDDTSPFPFSPGTKVLHPQFGPGTVRKREGDEENPKLTIHFQRAGTKKLLLNHCSLEILEP